MSESIEHLKSVVHRRGPLTKSDYSEAIGDLKRARMQHRIAHICCSVCEDTGHTAETCDHNPLRLARLWSQATGVWCCYHCGFVATNDQEAREHFGANDQQQAKCQRELGAALQGLLDRYVGMINSGDCGHWDPEQEAEVIAARKAIEQLSTCQRPEGS